MIYPIECSDSYGINGIKDATDLAQWLNSWMCDDDSTECTISKCKDQPGTSSFSSDNYALTPATAGDTQ